MKRINMQSFSFIQKNFITQVDAIKWQESTLTDVCSCQCLDEEMPKSNFTRNMENHCTQGPTIARASFVLTSEIVIEYLAA